jgi:hypothetical protein
VTGGKPLTPDGDTHARPAAQRTWSSDDGRIELFLTAESPAWQARIKLPTGQLLESSTDEQDLGRAREWALTQVRDALAAMCRRGLEVLIIERRYTLALETARRFAEMLGGPDERFADLLLILINGLTSSGRNADAVPLFGYLTGVDVARHDLLAPILGTCALGLESLDQTRAALKLMPPAFADSSLGRLIGAVLADDRAAITSAYTPYRTVQASENYLQPHVDTFFLKHHLASRGVPCDRRDRVPGKPALCLSSLAFHGRLGHTMIDYLVGRLYAEAHGWEIETPEWQGQFFFELDDPRVTQGGDRPLVREIATQDADRDIEFDGRDIGIMTAFLDRQSGQHGSPFTPRNRAYARGIFRIRPHWTRLFEPVLGSVRRRGKTIVALHVRLGDRGRSLDVAPYKAWLGSLWPALDAPLLYIASDELDVAKTAFAEYDPIGLSDLPAVLPMASHLLDQYILMKSDVLAIGRGAFGLWAAALREDAAGVYALASHQGALVPYDPWCGPSPS